MGYLLYGTGDVIRAAPRFIYKKCFFLVRVVKISSENR